jgi:hypothetical protein
MMFARLFLSKSNSTKFALCADPCFTGTVHVWYAWTGAKGFWSHAMFVVFPWELKTLRHDTWLCGKAWGYMKSNAIAAFSLL